MKCQLCKHYSLDGKLWMAFPQVIGLSQLVCGPCATWVRYHLGGYVSAYPFLSPVIQKSDEDDNAK